MPAIADWIMQSLVQGYLMDMVCAQCCCHKSFNETNCLNTNQVKVMDCWGTCQSLFWPARFGPSRSTFPSSSRRSSSNGRRR